MNDSQLIWEAYNNDSQFEKINESVMSAVLQITKDLFNRLRKGGLKKEDLVYYLRLLKSESESSYKRLIKGIKSYIKYGEVLDREYEKIIHLLVLVIMYLVVVPGSILTVKILQTPIDTVVDYLFNHRHAISTFVDDIINAVEKFTGSL